MTGNSGSSGSGRLVLRQELMLPPADVWELLIDSEAQRRWLGTDARIRPAVGALATLPLSAGRLRQGRVSRLEEGQALELELNGPNSPGTAETGVVRFEVRATKQHDRALFVIEERALNSSGDDGVGATTRARHPGMRTWRGFASWWKSCGSVGVSARRW